MESMNDTIVRALLAAAAIDPPESEVEAMIQSYPALRAAADRMYSMQAEKHLPAFSPTAPDAEER
jgi:hypothetical protein